MNQLLPTPRDLPPASRAKIREELQRVAERGQSRSLRFAPVLTAAVAALAVVGLVVWLAPWTQRTAVPATTTPWPSAPPPPATSLPAPVIPGMSTADMDRIAHGCQDIAHVPGTPRLYNLLTDDAGKFALVYTEGFALNCTLDRPDMPFNSGLGSLTSLEWLPGEMSVDANAANAGETSKHGTTMGDMTVAGRVTSKVAKVTYTADGTTVTGTIANGTYIARVVRPPTWKIPKDWSPGVVRAYDANGSLIAAANDPQFSLPPCYTSPDHKVVIPTMRDSALLECAPAARWR